MKAFLIVATAVVSGLVLVATSAATTPAHSHVAPHALAASDVQPLAIQVARARLATAKYVTDLDRAKADGYGIITRSIPNMASKNRPLSHC